MADMILMDMRMPEMTGLEAASQLTRELRDVIEILTSAFEVEGSGVRRRLSLSVWQHHNRKSISNSLRGIRAGAQS
jgi:CheY-like chemotaxis protein